MEVIPIRNIKTTKNEIAISESFSIRYVIDLLIAILRKI